MIRINTNLHLKMEIDFKMMKQEGMVEMKLEHFEQIENYEVESEIRNTIKRLGGTMPERLPTPKKSLKELEKDKFEKLERKNKICKR